MLALSLLCALTIGAASGCGKAKEPAWKSKEVSIIDDNYRTWYEIFVYSFCDSGGDGIAGSAVWLFGNRRISFRR